MEDLKNLRELIRLCHTGVFGKTQTGKTYLTNRIHKVSGFPSIFFNTKKLKRDNIYGKKVNRNSTITKINKLNYRPSSDPEEAERELRLLWRMLKDYKPQNRTCLLFIDEAHLFSDRVLKTLTFQSLGFGVRVFMITQRPTSVSPNVRSQLGQTVLFKLKKAEIGYFRYYQYNYEEIMEAIEKGGKYSFLVDPFEGNLTPYKI